VPTNPVFTTVLLMISRSGRLHCAREPAGSIGVVHRSAAAVMPTGLSTGNTLALFTPAMTVGTERNR
jgi:hypothetical protein